MLETDLERFAAGMELLFKAFSKPADKDISKICFSVLQHLTLGDALHCISLAATNEERFPSPYALKRYVSMIPPRNVPRIENVPFGHRDEKLAHDSGRLINGYLSGKLTRQGLIEGMGVMGRQYPGMGWDHEAAQLVGFFRETPENNGSGLTVTL